MAKDGSCKIINTSSIKYYCGMKSSLFVVTEDSSVTTRQSVSSFLISLISNLSRIYTPANKPRADRGYSLMR